MTSTIPDQKLLFDSISKIVGENDVSIDETELFAYSLDASNHQGEPWAIVRPESKDELVQILKYCNEGGIPVNPRGAGTSLAGQALTLKGGIILDMRKMNKIKEIAIGDRTVVVEPGVLYSKLNEELSKFGYCFPPEPGSAMSCTVGGMVGNNASGIRAVKYGVTRDFVLGLEVVLPNGDVIKTGSRSIKTSSGYDLTRLFVGSEGTLGVFTEIALKILPMPKYAQVLIAVFKSVVDAGKVASQIINSGITPSAMEFVDQFCAAAMNPALKKPLPLGEANLMIETDGSIESVVNAEIEKVRKICQENGAVEIMASRDPEERLLMWRARDSVYTRVTQLRGENLVIHAVSDTGVPISRVPEALRELKEVAKKAGAPLMVMFGHIGDGNVHIGLSIDQSKEIEKGDRIARAIAEIVLNKYKGTITAEHGAGLTKAMFLPMEHGLALEYMTKIKKVFDPRGIMNPGVMGLDGIPKSTSTQLPKKAGGH
ncbi:MAG: FAD-binding oxidoreductase [Promethearchaeati archaeon SRVP18_Atabeyarchaeia-1]